MLAPNATQSMAARLQDLSKQLSLAEKLSLFDKLIAVRKYPDEYLGDSLSDEENEDDLNEGEYLANLGHIRDFLFLGEPFKHLATAIRQTLYYDDRTKMAEIRRSILEGLSLAVRNNCQNCPSWSSHYNYLRHPTHPENKKRSDNHSFYSVSFNVEWDLLGFLRSQFDDRIPLLGSLVVLTGSALYAQATTCSDYLQNIWPHSGALFLSTLQTAVKSSPTTGIQSNTRQAVGKSITFPLSVVHFPTNVSQYGSISMGNYNCL